MSALLVAALVLSSHIHLAPTEDTPPAAQTLRFPPGAHEPELAVDDADHVAIVCASNERAYVRVSRDRGATFSDPTTLPAAGTISVGMRRGPKIAIVDERTLCVALCAGERGGGKDGDVLAFRSTDLGATWSAPVRVNTTPSSAREGLHALASGPKGELACAWIDLDGDAPDVVLALSTDDGSTFGTNRRLGRYAKGASSALCPCCSPSIAIDRDGTLYVAWREERSGKRDVVLATSHDAFATRATLQRLGTARWELAACPMDGGSVRAAGDDVAIVWRCDTDVLLASTRLPETSFRIGAGAQPVLAIGKDLHAVWSSDRFGALRWRTLAKGFEGPPARELAPRATACVIASSPTRGRGPVIAAWETSYDENGAIRVTRLED